jgi:hypothetical protein
VTNEDMLALLKFAGPVVGLAAALWSTTQKITYEGADGGKKLTLQGRVMVGIILLSGLVSLLSLGFESLLREEQARNAAEKQQLAKQAELGREARDRADAAATRAKVADEAQALALAGLKRDAEQQKLFLEQRFQIAAAAAEQQRRASEISTQIAREANLRLGEAERTLAEFERVNYPLRKIEASFELDLNLSNLGPDWPVDALWAEIQRRLEAEVVPTRRHLVDTIYLEPEMFGKIAGRDNFDHATHGTRGKLRFAAGEEAASPAADAARGSRTGLDSEGVLFDLRLKRVRADLRSRRLRAVYSGEKVLAVEGVIASGEKVSLSDVNRLVPVITIERSSRYPRGADTLVSVSVRLNGFERFSASPDLPIADETAVVRVPAVSP